MAALKNPHSLYDAYEKLAQAIILSAAEDYRQALQSEEAYMRIHKKKSKSMESIESFFVSDWFKTLTPVDGTYIIKKLRKEAGKV